MHLPATSQVLTVVVTLATIVAFGDVTTERQCPQNKYFSSVSSRYGCRPCEDILGICHSPACVRRHYPSCVETYENLRGNQTQFDTSSFDTKSTEQDGLTTMYPNLNEEENRLQCAQESEKAGLSLVKTYEYVIIAVSVLLVASVAIIVVLVGIQCRKLQQKRDDPEAPECLNLMPLQPQNNGTSLKNIIGTT